MNDDFQLRGLITVKDIQKASDYPKACRDTQERLRVGAAVGVGVGTDERVEALVKAGVDVITVDTAHGHSVGVLNRVAWIKGNYPDVQVIGGNIATAEAAWHWSRPARMPSRWALAPAQSAPRASSPASACHR